MQRNPTPHVDGRPVSRTTYDNYGCRCDGCHAAKTAKNPNNNTRRAQLRADARIIVEPIPRLLRKDARREPVEQAIASGHTPSRIMADLGVTYRYVVETREHMDRCAA